MTTEQDIIQNISVIYNDYSKHDNIRQMIANHFIPTKEESKNNAEISTPIILVEQMINSIPDEFWTKPRKVFEPCCGKGNFVLAIFDKFFFGLQKSIKDIHKRCEVIVNECIYYADLTPLNVFIVSQLLRHHVAFYTKGGKSNLKFNQQVGNTLDMKTTDENGFGTILDAGFDAVICNPPYQNGKGANGTLWDKFVLFSLKSIKPETGYLLFIHPSGWRNIDGKFKKVQQQILSKNILYLEIHGTEDGQKIFGCGTRYDWYLLKNESAGKTDTVVRFQDGNVMNINLKDIQFIPNAGYEQLNKLYAQPGQEKVNVMYSASLYHTMKDHIQDHESHVFKHPVIYTISSKGVKNLRFSSKDHGDKGHYGIQKLIWSSGSISTVQSYLDMKGEYAMSEFAHAIVDEPCNLPYIQKAFDSEKFRNIMHFCAVGQQHINRRIIASFRKDFWIEFV